MSTGLTRTHLSRSGREGYSGLLADSTDHRQSGAKRIQHRAYTITSQCQRSFLAVFRVVSRYVRQSRQPGKALFIVLWLQGSVHLCKVSEGAFEHI